MSSPYLECFIENPLAFTHDETVGHTGDVITHGAVRADFLGALLRVFADFFRVREIVFKELPKHFRCSQVGLMHNRVEI
jgi:hypothetical protein